MEFDSRGIGRSTKLLLVAAHIRGWEVKRRRIEDKRHNQNAGLCVTPLRPLQLLMFQNCYQLSFTVSSDLNSYVCIHSSVVLGRGSAFKISTGFFHLCFVLFFCCRWIIQKCRCPVVLGRFCVCCGLYRYICWRYARATPRQTKRSIQVSNFAEWDLSPVLEMRWLNAFNTRRPIREEHRVECWSAIGANVGLPSRNGPSQETCPCDQYHPILVPAFQPLIRRVLSWFPSSKWRHNETNYLMPSFYFKS